MAEDNKNNECQEENTVCRICYDDECEEILFRACRCAGTMAHVHHSCLRQWLTQSSITQCELCHTPFVMSIRRRRIPRCSCRRTCVRSPLLHFFMGVTLVFLAMCLSVFVMIRVVQDGHEYQWANYTYLVISLVGFFIGSMLYSSVRGEAWERWNAWLRGNVVITIEPYQEETEPTNEEDTETNL